MHEAQLRECDAGPAGLWIMRMRWHELLFAHWPVRPTVLRPLIPQGLELDTFDGEAWIGVVPFHMTGVRPRWLPPVPGTRAFPEVNVRTYVTARGKLGVWFFSLDATSKLGVRAARWAFNLPYFDADISVAASGGEIRYASNRTHRNAPAASLRMRYRPTGPECLSRSGDIDHFLTHRLCLYAADRRGRVYRGDIEHERWPLQPAEGDFEVNRMTEQIGVKLPEIAPLLHYSHRLDAIAWRLRRV